MIKCCTEAGKKVYFRYVNEFGQVKENEILFEGVIPNIERRYRETSSDYIREQMEKYMAEQACPKCKGGRLKPESLAVFVGNKTIADVTKYSVQEVQEFFSNVELTEKQQK